MSKVQHYFNAEHEPEINPAEGRPEMGADGIPNYYAVCGANMRETGGETRCPECERIVATLTGVERHAQTIQTRTPDECRVNDESTKREGAIMAHVIEVPDKAMLATERCARCGAQAYVAAEGPMLGDEPLLFCAHHFRKSEETLMAMDVKIADHRPYLNKMESGVGTALTAK